MRLVASMICRDELTRFQPALTRHLLSYCDEVRVLADGCRDGTGGALERVSADVRVLRNRTSRWDRDGEGAARQQLLEWTLAAGADFVLSIDADEVVPDGRLLREAIEGTPDWLLDEPDPVVFSLRMAEVWERGRPGLHAVFRQDPTREFRGVWQIRVDGGWAPRWCPIVWQAPPTSMAASDAWARGWTIPNRRLACGREPELVRHLDPIKSGIDVLHLGWSLPGQRRARYERYAAIDGGDYHASEHIESILAPPTLEAYPAPEVAL